METITGEDLPYVVIGRGAAAVVNLATLPTEVRQRRLVVIGDTDPWSLTEDCDMGQWPKYLSLPGFENKPTALSSDRWQRSQEFAGITALELKRLKNLYRHLTIDPGSVTNISGLPGANFAIEMKPIGSPAEDPPVTIRATHVDICTGPGRPEWPRWASDFTPPSSNPNLVVAGDGYRRTNCPLPAGPDAWVVVYGGSGTAAWCAERALDRGKRVLWMARSGFDLALISDRNADILKKDGDRHVPLKDRLWLCRGEITHLAIAGQEQLSLASTGRKWIGRSGKEEDPLATFFDQLVIAVGQVESVKPLLDGELSKRLKILTKPPGSPEEIPEFDLGRATRDRRLRLLGAAGISKQKDIVDRDSYDACERTLHPQAHGTPNFPVATHRIAWANGRTAASLELASPKELALLVSAPRRREIIENRKTGKVGGAAGR